MEAICCAARRLISYLPSLKSSETTVFAWVFSAAVAIRALVNVVFVFRFGPYAVNHIEAWHYKGLMSGDTPVILQHGMSDPTVWLMRGVGWLVPQRFHLHAVEALSVILISLTAAFVAAIAYRLWGSRAGYLSGMAYAMMVQPIALAITGFTHDHVQLPLVAFSIYCAIRASNAGLFQGSLWAIAFVLTYEAGKFVNDSIKVGIACSAIYVGYLVWMAISKMALRGRGPKWIPWAVFLFVLILSIAIVSATIIPNVLGATLSKLPQGRTGSADVMPTNLSTGFMRYNALLLILPLLIASSIRYKDPLGLALMGFGAAFAWQMDRGTRILDLGIALSFGLAMARAPPYLEFKDLKIALWQALACFVGASHLILAWLTYNLLAFEIIFLLGGLSLAGCLVLSGDKRAWIAITVLIIVGATTNILYVLTVPGRKIVSDTEYRMWDWLSNNNGGGLVLAGWDRGFMVEAVAGLGPVSSPNHIDRRVHSYLWMPEAQAAAMLAYANVSHVMVTSENFNVAKVQGDLVYRIVGGLLFPEEYAPDPKAAQRYAIYKLRHNATGDGFKLVWSGEDAPAGMSYLLYEVKGDPEKRIGGIAYNTGAAATMRMLASDFRITDDLFERRYGLVGEETFAEGEVKEVDYPMALAYEAPCQMRGGNEPLQSQGGVMTLANDGPAGQNIIRLALMSDGAVVATFNETVSIDTGGKVSFRYMFNDLDPFIHYELRMSRVEGLRIVNEESYGPDAQGIRFLEVFC